MSAVQVYRKHCGKRRNCSFRAIYPFPTVFSNFWRILCQFYQIRNCCLLTLSAWKSLNFVVGKELNNSCLKHIFLWSRGGGKYYSKGNITVHMTRMPVDTILSSPLPVTHPSVHEPNGTEGTWSKGCSNNLFEEKGWTYKMLPLFQFLQLKSGNILSTHPVYEARRT